MGSRYTDSRHYLALFSSTCMMSMAVWTFFRSASRVGSDTFSAAATLVKSWSMPRMLCQHKQTQACAYECDWQSSTLSEENRARHGHLRRCL